MPQYHRLTLQGIGVHAPAPGVVFCGHKKKDRDASLEKLMAACKEPFRVAFVVLVNLLRVSALLN